MAQAACAASDLVVITSDNPRTEDAESILDDVERGCAAASAAPALARVEPGALPTASRAYARVADRRAAIALAVAAARPSDTVLIAGKGHEDYQILGTTKHPFDDRVEAAGALASRTQEAR
jgi:UDP-N-acetylmuramoyl-L-alanyl-D-glutamate--2,6-diaminopimelate ligase